MPGAWRLKGFLTHNPRYTKTGLRIENWPRRRVAIVTRPVEWRGTTMAKKKTSEALAVGARVRVKSGTTIPEFPDVPCGGWTGTVVEMTGKKPNSKFVIEWDDATLAAIPEPYLRT